ncbi:MAG: sialate O-acetylesterase [Defluviitaleaceae bacterium]|nr:sialate O-acetylesterase [Defluviitaleaceae bacterium]
MVTLPVFFDDGVVLAKNSRVWGWATPGQIVSAEFLGKKYESQADSDGRFSFLFNSENFGGPFTMKIEEKIISDVHIGRVWFCGGQSNMESPLSRSRMYFNEHIEDDERIRIFQVEKDLNFTTPQNDVKGKWNAACGEFLNHMYAVPYFFARKLLSVLPDDGAKVGLVCAPAGGTPIEAWLPEEIIREKYPHYIDDLEEVQHPGFVERKTENAESTKNAWLRELNDKDTGLKENWFDKDFDDSDWEERPLLDNTNFPTHGSVWLRKKVHITKTETKNETKNEIGAGSDTTRTDSEILNFGRIEDSVTVYINGVEVTHIAYQYPPCTCLLPKNLLVAGENIIAVRVVGECLRPLIVPGKEYFLQTPEGRIGLDGEPWKYREGAQMPACPPGVWFYSRPCGVHNHMLAPLLGLSVEGALWYQGESNTYAPERYEPMFCEFVKYFRKNFGGDNKNLPFIFTQLANYIDPNGDGENWAKMREQQRQCLKIPNTAMAVAIDCGEYSDLHPVDKKTVGERLALHALRMVYGEKINADGPTFSHSAYENGELKIFFENAQGLWSKNGRPQLELFFENENVRAVYAQIKENALVVACKSKPEKVRFGFTDCPSVALYNASNLPASPFENEGI